MHNGRSFALHRRHVLIEQPLQILRLDHREKSTAELVDRHVI
jgi:hypothetical protein